MKLTKKVHMKRHLKLVNCDVFYIVLHLFYLVDIEFQVCKSDK